MENKQHNSRHANGLNGFFFGVIVGVALALLFTTKKGRQILRTLADEGINKLSEWEKNVDEKGIVVDEAIDDDEVSDQPYVKTMSSPDNTPEQIFHEKILEKHEYDHESNGHQAAARVKTSTRRLFRGIPRKS